MNPHVRSEHQNLNLNPDYFGTWVPVLSHNNPFSKIAIIIFLFQLFDTILSEMVLVVKIFKSKKFRILLALRFSPPVVAQTLFCRIKKQALSFGNKAEGLVLFTALGDIAFHSFGGIIQNFGMA